LPRLQLICRGGGTACAASPTAAVADGGLLDGIMYATGQLQEGIQPFETRFRVEFHEEADGRTRLEIRQWLPEQQADPSEEGCLEAFTKLDATLMSGQAVGADRRGEAAKLIYVSNVSLDGYIEDEHGRFDWTATDDELFAFITDLVRPVGTYLYGRRLYETMAVWETDPALGAQSELMGDFANVWQAASKVVYSTTLDAVSTANTRLERNFDPASVRDMKALTTSDLIVGGASLAAHALEAGLVDECHLFIRPILVGGGKPALPRHVRTDLEMLDERRLSNGVVYLRYRIPT